MCIFVIILAFVLVIAALWPLLCRLIPPTKHAGIELYESGEYLQYEKGEVFREQIAKLPFVADAQVLSFEYYDFWFRDAIFRDDPFPDAYIVQLNLRESYNGFKQYLEEQAYDKSEYADGSLSTYYLGGSNDTDCFYVVTHNQSQEVYCFLLTDRSTWANEDDFFAMNLWWVPVR